MRSKYLALRILHQIRHDKRTLALMFAAPVLLLTLVFFVLNSSASEFTVGIVNAPLSYVDQLEENNVSGIYCSRGEAGKLLEQGDIDAYIEIVNNKSYIYIDGTNSSAARQVINKLETSRLSVSRSRPDLLSEVIYVYGSEDLEMFDNFGSALIGIIIFFFVFLVAGISFLQERTSGTLERLLSTPIKRWEVVAGYALGFGVVTVLQSFLVTLYVVYVLDVVMIGSIFLVLCVTLLASMTALTMGILISTAANTEFQMIQFIPIVIVPQIFFCGLFELSDLWEKVGYLMPLHYVADALTSVMIRGGGFRDIAIDVTVLLLLCIGFMILNTLLLKKYRRI